MKMDLIPEVHKLLRYKKLDIIDIPHLVMATVSGHGETIASYLLSRGVLWCLAGPRVNGHFVWQLNIDYLRDGICEPIFFMSPGWVPLTRWFSLKIAIGINGHFIIWFLVTRIVLMIITTIICVVVNDYREYCWEKYHPKAITVITS